MSKTIHFEPSAVEKYSRVTSEVSLDVNKIAVSLDNDGESNQANQLRRVMEEVCSINSDLEDPTWNVSQLKSNAATLKKSINVLSEVDDIRIEQQITKLQGLYDCWKRLFSIDFDKEDK